MRTILPLVAMLAAAPARADITDSGNLIIGGQGIIRGTMTVQGSAFSAGGATFSVAGGSVTLGGRLNAAAAGILWADGTISTTAASGSGGAAVLSSSFSWLSSYQTWSATFKVAVGTVTMTIGARPVLVCATCEGGAYPASNSYCGMSYLVDGGFDTGLSDALGVMALYGNNAGSIGQGWCVKTRTLSAGTHSFALVIAGFGGAGCYCEGGSGAKHASIGAYELLQ